MLVSPPCSALLYQFSILFGGCRKTFVPSHSARSDSPVTMSSSSSSESTYWLKEDMIYDLNFEIGKGRFSTVYCATERSTQQLVAVKVFNMIASSGPAGARIEQRLYQVGELELLGLAQGGVSTILTMHSTTLLHLA